MEPKKPNPELLIKIKEKIKKETPHTRGYAKFISILRISLVIILVVVSTISLSIFLTDILQKIQGGEFENYSLLQNLLGFLFEFLVVTFLGVVTIYWIYRNTDWPFVKERLHLIIGSFVIISLLSTGLIVLSESEETRLGDFLDGVKDRIEDKLPFRNLLEDDNLKETHAIEGEIMSIEKDGYDYLIEIKTESKIIKLMLEKRFGEFDVGDRVKIEYEVDGPEQDIEMIEKI